MNTLKFSVTSSICVLLIGVLLVAWPEAAVTYLVIAIGGLFFLPGLLGMVGYFMASSKAGTDRKPAFPIVGLGSLLLGLWLMVDPAFFVSFLMYLLGGMLVLGALFQFMNYWSYRTVAKVSVVFYLMAGLMMVAGIVILLNPFQAAAVPFMILGISAIVYSVLDLVRLLHYRSQKNSNVVDVEVIEEK